MQVPLLVDDFLARPARLYPGKTAIVDGKLRFTYGEYKERVNQLSNALLSRGIGRGDRVCILSPNSHFFMESFYATSQIGAILVPLNYRLVPADHEFIINHAGVKAVLVDYEHTTMIDAIRERLPAVELWIVAAYRSVEAPGWIDWNSMLTGVSTNEPPACVRGLGLLLDPERLLSDRQRA